MSKSKNIIIQFTGSISCYKACDLVSRLIKDGHNVQTIATESALKFIGTATLEGLTDKPVLSSMFGVGENKAHVLLPKWADLILLYPATANTINKLAHGMADDLISALFLGNNFQVPYWIGPAMNHHMLMHPATQSSLELLSKWGVKILPTEEGMLACKEMGKGKLLSPEIVHQMIKDFFA